MSQLITCPACQRHVKSDEAACPFCQTTFSPAPPCAGGCSGPTAARLAKAALVAAGAALLGAACQSHSAIVPYGTPPQFDAGTDTHQDAGEPSDGPPDGGDAAK
jgi:hypothetical protein